MGERIDYKIPLNIENEARKYLDEIYNKKGFNINRINGIKNLEGDLILSKNNKKWLIEEKAASYYWPYMIFEEHQDYPNWDGWIFKTKADVIIYFYFKNRIPFICYFVDWKKAFKFYENTHDEWEKYENKKYKGFTIGIKIPWDELILWNIAFIIFKKE